LTIAEKAIADAFIAACFDELEAPKPGNVHVFADGHRMTIADFRRSAEAAAAPIARAGASVGERILGAVEATRAVVNDNTNLGIVLLCAPLARAAEQSTGSLRQATIKVLASLDREDADLAFRAIALAAPAGLGRVEAHDVFEPATVSLLEAMAAAAERDLIARQYVSGFADIFDLGRSTFGAADRRWGHDLKGATLAVYLSFLAAFPDTHIERKFGREVALSVQQEAKPLNEVAQKASDPALIFSHSLAFDARLKARGLNPGAAADLTVATLFSWRLDGAKSSDPIS
jgi:triphosphoribosyl-dephospho-CoA synthase